MTEEVDDGIIIPPPDIKIYADKAAAAIAKVGPGFETRLMEKEGSNPLFVFLNPNDPYNKYFKQRIKLVKEKKVEEREEQQQAEMQKVQAEAIKPPPLPPPPYELHYDLPHLSKRDQSILKLTAQFAAKNGARFTTMLSQKEQRNFQFEFLRPSNALYPYFMRLVDHYTNILTQPKPMMNALQSKKNDRYYILELISKRLAFEAFALNEVERKQKAEQERKLAFATIDWHDFVVVETIEFSSADDRAVLPPPLDLNELKNMTLVERRNMLIFDADIDVDKEMAIDADERPTIGVAAYPTAPSKSQPPPPKPKKSFITEICPICKQAVNSADLPEHMKLELRDPRHEKMVQAYQAKIRETNLVSNAELANNLSKLTQVRTDLVGGDSVAVQQRLQFEEDKRRESLKGKVIWDGKKNSVAAVTAQVQVLAQQIMAPEVPPAPTRNNGIQPPRPPIDAPPPPNTKRQKLDPNALLVTVQTPDKLLEFDDLTPLWTVAQLKEKLAQSVGIPVSKQKLVTEQEVVLKNALTLYESGIKNYDKLTLSFKGRGGKK